MNVFKSVKRMLIDKYIIRRNSVDELLSKIECASQHYRKVIENCINYLIVFSNTIKPYKCMKCGKIFFIVNSEKGCPFCNSLHTVGIDMMDFKLYVHSYCTSIYGKNLTYMEFLKEIVKNLCLNKICYFLESTSSLEIFTEKGTLKMIAKNGEIIEVELPWIDISIFTYIDEITTIASQYREKLLKNGIKYIIYKAYYGNIDVNHITLIKEGFIDVQFFKHLIDKLGLNKYIFNKGVLAKIFDIEYSEYVNPQKMLISTRVTKTVY